MIVWSDGQSYDKSYDDIYLLTDRSRIVTRASCERKRFYSYHWSGRGVQSTRESEDLIIGKAVHLAMESAWELDAPEAAQIAWDYVMETPPSWNEGGLVRMLGDTAQTALHHEIAMLSYGLVWAWISQVKRDWMDEYELLEIEPEIAWKMGEDLDGKWVVMMSRPDAVLRQRAGGGLVAVSYKTSKTFGDREISHLLTDTQKLTEGWAVTSKYGEQCHGVQYAYFIKGKQYGDPGMGGVKRYTSPLVRPYKNLSMGAIGSPSPDHFRLAYETTNEFGKKVRLGSNWDRVNIWEHVEPRTWMEWLDGCMVEGPDAIEGAIATPRSLGWNPRHAERWLKGALAEEIHYKSRLDGVKTEENLDDLIPLTSASSTSCWNFNRPCQYMTVCWQDESIESRIAKGYWQLRTPNHKEEFENED